VSTLGYLKTIDGIYVTEEELATTLADYLNTTASAAAMVSYITQQLDAYPTTTELTDAHYTKT